MDSIINAALEEICARGATGIPIANLWPCLAPALSSSNLNPSSSIKHTIWARLLSLPVLRFCVDATSIDPQHPKIQSLDESERLGLRIVADEQLRGSFMGLDDLNGKISEDQRRTLERIASARINGITQSDLAKEFGIKGNNFFYQVRNLESQQLIVKQSTIVREKELGSEVEKRQKNIPLAHTHLLHLYRYAKTVNLNSQQRIEITKPAWTDIVESIGNGDKSSVFGDASQGEYEKEDVLIKDYLPAMKAVCDKLQEATEKVLVVSMIKLELGYRTTRGHRAWRTVVTRLEDANLVEKFQAEVDGRDVQCLRLLKKFDPNDFISKPSTSWYDGFDQDNLVKHGKRGHVTDQFLELPIEHRIYDMVDAEGTKGITLLEICRRLGLNSKKMYLRISGMCSRFGMCMESEKPNKTVLYRIWTCKNYKQYSANISSGNSQEVPIKNELSTSSNIIPYGESSPNVDRSDSSFQVEDLHSQKLKSHSAQIDFTVHDTCDKLDANCQATMCCTVPQNLTNELTISGNDTQIGTALTETDSYILASERTQSVSSMSSKRALCYQIVTSIGERRERCICERLKDEKFILYCDLYRWLKGLEKDKRTVMDRKTLDRTLNKLQQDGSCKLTQVTIPALTNFNRNREQGVILHPSVESISSDILNQIYESYKVFEFQTHSRESAKSAEQPATVLTDVKRTPIPVDDKPVVLEAMRANGYVQAKMVRAKLLHNFLWGYISSLPDWKNAFLCTKDDHILNNHRKTCQFAMGPAIEAMPLELFLQIAGSAKHIDDMVQKCRLGLRLMDLSVPEHNQLLDTNATGRVSRIINILLRLKLIQLVWQGSASMDLQPHATSTHTLELEPYIEEPLPRVPPSLKMDSLDLRPRIRHDFVFLSQEDVNAYWETLEYCYAQADLASALLSFPGSVVNEAFNFRSWTSIRVMTADQRMELLRRMEFDDLEKKIPFNECVKIARELNLSVEQVLRVSYDKQQKRSQRVYKTSKSKEQEKCMGTDCEPVAKRRRSSKNQSAEHDHNTVTTEASCRPTMSILPCADGNNLEIDSSIATGHKINDNPMQEGRDNSHGNSAVESEPHEEDDPSLSFIQSGAFSTPNPIRERRFTWTHELDRQIVIEYARYRVLMGERFHRVIWSSIPDLPTHHLACGRRMNKLNSDTSTRRAVMKLCNLLAEQYEKYLHNAWRSLGDAPCLGDSTTSIRGTVAEEAKNMLIGCVDSSRTKSQQNCWADFEDPDVKMAVDEVLRCKRMARLERVKRTGSQHGQGWPDTATEGTNSDVQEQVASMEQSFISSIHGDKDDSHDESRNSNTKFFPISAQSRPSSHNSQRKFMKLSNNRGIDIRRKVYESVAVANAVELLKRVFLSNSATPEVQTSLAETLQLYPKCELIAAFNFLKEKEFVIVGVGNRPPVLSQKFWLNASSSPFPIDSGKRAASFATWLHNQDKHLEEGIDLSSDIQCGEIFHLFALVSSGEIAISPGLPKEGTGEADEPKSSQSLSAMDNEVNYLVCCDEKDKKQKSQGKMDADFRREKGFPGIKVLINRATSPRFDAFLCPTDEQNDSFLSAHEDTKRLNYSDMETIPCASSFSSLGLSDNSRNEHQSGASLGESSYDQMTNYAAHLASSFVGRIEAFTFCPEHFRSVCSVIDQAGDQGLNIEEISRVMGIQGVELTEVVIETLEVFQLAFKVPAYNSVRVVASSYRLKYFIGLPVDRNQDNYMASYMRSRGINYKREKHFYREKHDDVDSSENGSRMSLSTGHKLTLLDLPPKPSTPQVETQLNEECVSSERNESENKLFCDSGVLNVYRSILPWINSDGSTNSIMYKGLTRRVLGIAMQNPGVLEEDIICQMDVLNPQSCRRLLETMILDNHISMKMMHQTTGSNPPSILQSLFPSGVCESKSQLRKHYFANPMSTSFL